MDKTQDFTPWDNKMTKEIIKKTKKKTHRLDTVVEDISILNILDGKFNYPLPKKKRKKKAI
jgi:hypothetical protein